MMFKVRKQLFMPFKCIFFGSGIKKKKLSIIKNVYFFFQNINRIQSQEK